MVWLLYDSASKKFLLDSLVISCISLWFLTFSIVFLKTALLINLNKYISKPFFAFFLNSIFISMYDVCQAFWLNLIFLNNHWWFNASFKFICDIFFFYASWLQVIQLFEFSFFQVKMVNHCENCHCEIIVKSLFSLQFFAGSFCDIAYPNKLFTHQHLR